MSTPSELKEALAELEAAKKTLKKKKSSPKKKKEVIEVGEKRRLNLQKVFEEQYLKPIGPSEARLSGGEIKLIGHYSGKLLQQYKFRSNNIPVNIRIVKPRDEYVPIYDIYFPDIGEGTNVILDNVRNELTSSIGVRAREVLDIKLTQTLEDRFRRSAKDKLKQYFPNITVQQQAVLEDILISDMLGLGKIDLLLSDEHLEEIVVNNAKEPLWVYHKMHGWLKTNARVRDEAQIYDFSSNIGRKVERQINTLNPLMDAHLVTGERTNATLFPISNKGNTITIRKFARDPWTITDFIENNTLDPAIAAILWTGMQYELNMIVSGGTASGKTSMLNSLTPFLPPNHRIISIEDTKELRLPNYLHWVPMITRQPNPEGKGGVEMLDLMVNALRMRPDRILVGEVRRHEEAEVLFEAMHTGHSVYATLHANTAEEVHRRLTTAPLSISETLMESLHLVLVQFRHRKLGIRRTLELAEVVPTAEGQVSFRTIYKWRPGQDVFTKMKDSVRLLPEIQMFSGLSDSEIKKELTDKEDVLKWILKYGIKNTDAVGRIIGEYYTNENKVMEYVKKDIDPVKLFER